MPANFPGAQNNLPGAYFEGVTISQGTAGLGNARIAVLMGEGARRETLVSSAIGNGRDGFNAEYSSNTGSDGRHFKTSLFPLISNRSRVFRNGITLTGFEQVFDSSSGNFSSIYDYRLDITDGTLELQGASLVDQGGSFYTTNQLNTGNGIIGGLSLIDLNAPTETWTIRCVSTRRDGYGDPIDGYGKFIAQGSVSGILLDGYGNQITWVSNGSTTNNSILSFSITDGSIPFIEGDRLTVKVKGGALSLGESLSIEYIAEIDLNDPDLFEDPNELYAKHGFPSLTNRLSLGAQLLFRNGAQAVYACQTAPSVPRRVFYNVETNAAGGTTSDDLIFPLPPGVEPDPDSSIKFLITDPVTQIESQIVPNKVEFYNSTYTTNPEAFFDGSVVYSYTVVLTDSIINSATNGVIESITATTATLSSTSVLFNFNDIGRSVKLLSPSTNFGTFTIASVIDGIATISDGSSSFTDEEDVRFEVIDDTQQSAIVLISPDLALGAGTALSLGVIDIKDSDFFDAGWSAALEAVEGIEVDMIVPLPSQTISSIFQSVKAHCESMSQIGNRKERIMIIGAISGLQPDNITGEEPAAVEDIGILEGIQGDDVTEILSGNVEDLTNYSVPDAFGGTFRVIYMYPDEVLVTVGGERQLVDGFFMAPALAGWFSATSNIAMPATKKVLTGFDIGRNKIKVYRPRTASSLATAGVCLVEPVSGGGRIIWGKTTKQGGNPNDEEASVIFIRDRIAKSLRKTFEDQFVGTPEDDTTLGSMKSVAEKSAQSYKTSKIIKLYRDISVIKDAVEPRQYNVKMEVFPTQAVNWIYIQVSFNA